MKLRDLLKEAVAEISYKKSGLKNPDKADLNKDKEISSYEKKRGGAIEKSMKAEFRSQAPKKEGIKFGNEERPMETMPSFSREEMVASNPMNNVCKECGAPMMYEDRMCMECGWMEESVEEGEEELYKKGDMVGDDYPGDDEYASLAASFIGGDGDGDGADAADADSADGGVAEGQDHEVSMARNSLQSIVSAASELMNKIGEEEKDIPAWIQDHITNAANYIQQAASNYHEYSQPEAKDGLNLEDLMEAKGVDKFGYTQNAQAAGPFRGAQMPMQMASGNLEEKKKPSAGLSKKQKSAISKKAHAGKDIGKKGKGFADVEKKAKESGATNPKAVAAAAMWKGAAKRAHK